MACKEGRETGGTIVPLAGNAANCTRCLLQLLQRTTHNVATGNREVKMKYYKHFYTIR